MTQKHTEIALWKSKLERATQGSRFARVVVLEETGSTQDAARELSRGSPGFVVTAARQTAGRGRLGRTWADTGSAGLAMTFVLDASDYVHGVLSLAAGLAAASTLAAAIPESGVIGLKWPNDVVERSSGRKLAGVLIEQFDGLALVGIGMNIQQGESSFPPELRQIATSVRLVSDIRHERLLFAMALTRTLHETLKLTQAVLISEWMKFDTLRGSRQTFTDGEREITGIVKEIDPLEKIEIELGNGETHTLRAHTATLVKARSA